MLRVIDISSVQAGLDLSTIANQFDAVMIKATGGNGYVNPSCDTHVQQAIALGKKWGVYHYFSDGFNDGDPIAEADWFVNNCLGYIGKGILALDWERGGNPDVSNTGKALAWLQHVELRTNVKPLTYMSLSLVTGVDWSSVIANNNGLWCADYVQDNMPIVNFGMSPNNDPNPTWDGTVNDVLWQFTSTGQLDGYSDNLDCSFFYGTQASWDAYAGTHTASPPPVPTSAPQPTPDPVPQPNPIPSPVSIPDPTLTPESTSDPVSALPAVVTSTTLTNLPKPSPKLNWFQRLIKAIEEWWNA